MKEVLPHKADVSSLEVRGHGMKRPATEQKNNIEFHIFGKNHPMEITDNVQLEEDPDYQEKDEFGQPDLLEDQPDIIETPLMGQRIGIDKSFSFVVCV